MLLAMDVGNTQTVLGLFSGRTLVRNWRIRTVTDGTADEYGSLIRDLFRNEGGGDEVLEGMVAASVVPPLNGVVREIARKYLKVEPLFITPENVPGLRVCYQEPRDVGADRVVNALAALEESRPPLIIVDFGTAITFDVINEEGDYVGGAIGPGIGISLEALFEKAARLQPVDLTLPPSPVGGNTVESIQSGVLFGYASLVEGMIERISEAVGKPCRVIATGGYAPMMAELCPRFSRVDADLTLKGLCIAYRRLTEEAPSGS